jgi:hypothetical protein
MTRALFILLLFIPGLLRSQVTQDQPVYPSLVSTGTFLGETPPLRDLPAITQDEWNQMARKAKEEERNPELANRSYPYAATALPKGPDPVWQRQMGNVGGNRAPIQNFQAQTSPYYPPDANGVVGPNHYMQTINTTYAIYNKSGALVAGPTNLNTLFSGVIGATCNDGDPVVLFDEQANRWLVTEFSICGSNDYMLLAVSTTSDPTGTWYKYSFDVADMPDYPKFGVWRDGYYMGTNNSSGNDIYVFQRSVMLTGGASPQMVGFANAWRPTTIDGFMCVPPLDNDGAFAPTGSPGLFITINDDAIGGGSDQLWIYELAVNWTTPGSSTFTRTQQINVAAFDSNFGANWTNIAQYGTAQELDAIPQVIMNAPQYRNFGTYQTIVCCHTVDVDATDHAGIRWYELRKTTGSWSIRQQATYAPDGHSRWMGSIMLNGDNELALGYSISSSSIYPGIRYCGQSSDAYAEGLGVMDISESIIQDGAGSQTGAERWGDYSAMSVDPSNDSVFWFTTEYISSGGSRLTKIASFNIPLVPGKWSGATSSSWNTLSNWTDGNVPGSTVDVTIPATATNWPVFTGDLTLGTNCGNITLQGSSQMTVTGNLTVGSGKSLNVAAGGTILVGGNWSILGTFNYGNGTVEFNGSGASILSQSISNITLTDYTESTFASGMTVLSGATTSTATGNDGSQNITLPFTFYFAGFAATSAHVTTNGWLSLNGSGTTASNNTYLFTSTAPNVTLAPWFDDLRDDGTSAITYKTEGTTPDRVFTVEWSRIRSYSGSTYVRISFQVKLYETSNIIEFHYGTVESGTHSASESASIGLEDATSGTNHYLEATTGTMNTVVTNLSSATNWPSSNYRFTPNPRLHFNNLTINKTNSTVSVSSDVKVHGNISVNPGSTLDVPASKNIEVLGAAK